MTKNKYEIAIENTIPKPEYDYVTVSAYGAPFWKPQTDHEHFTAELHKDLYNIMEHILKIEERISRIEGELDEKAK
jgi:hypothetical protein